MLWWVERPKRLAREAYAAIEAPANAVFVSAVTAWELAIKGAKSRLELPADLLDELHRQAFVEVPITWAHSLAAGGLPPHHDDPFDRMLVAQARAEQLTIVTRDPKVALYDVEVMPA